MEEPTKKKYSTLGRILIFVVALFFLLSFFDGIMEVQAGETVWNFSQIMRVVFSFILALLYAYIATLTNNFNRYFGLGLEEPGKFWFLFFILVIIFLTALAIFPAT